MTSTERAFADVLADIVRVDRVSVVSNFFDELGADSMVMAQFCARVRKRADVPSVSMKDIYQYPTIRSLARGLKDATPTPVAATSTYIGKIFAEVLADIVRVERVSVDSDFFDELGADSMVMAQFCARVRKRADVPSVSMKDIYRHRTIRSLATALADIAPPPVDSPDPASIDAQPRAGTRQYLLCGALQFLAFLGYLYVVALVTTWGFGWISEGSGPADSLLRSVLFGGATFLGLATVPLLAKWVLVGRWKSQEIPFWSLTYVRFWVVKTLIRVNPLVLFLVGSPLYALYLRALGAKIGRNVVILTKYVPVCTDLLTIGDGTVIRKDTSFSCYRAHAGLIQTGAVKLGKNVLVGEAAVLDIETSLGDGAQLGHRSSLHPGQAVPAGERWHGSPAQPAEVDYRLVDAINCSTPRRAVYGALTLLHVLVVTLPLGIGGIAVLLVPFPEISALLEPGPVAFTRWSFYFDALKISAALFFGAVLAGLVFVVTVPRVLNLAITPDKVYPLYGFHYSIHRTIMRMTNIKMFGALLGDSSYIVPYLRALGYDLSEVVQTGSNFGTSVKHDNPFLVTVGSGTMIADGLQVINADFSSTSFRVSRASIGPRNFLGNGIVYPPQSRTGDNCLLASKVMVPMRGKVRENVGLLGSPSFEIPRSVERDARFDHLKSADELGRHLAAKNRYNLRTIGISLLVGWMQFLGITLIAMAAAELYPGLGAWAIVLASILSLVFNVAFGMLVEWTTMRFRPLSPQFCSIYDPYFWWHERYWKMLVNPKFFNGTPLKGLIWRLLGVRVGKRLFDDGCDIPERTLVTIGDDCTLNNGCWLQCHSQEDGTFKSDRITLCDGCTLGVSAWTHYGVTMRDGAVLRADSFLMKGEEMPANARWGGNPAREMWDHTSELPCASSSRSTASLAWISAKLLLSGARRSTVSRCRNRQSWKFSSRSTSSSQVS